ncbi:MAG TPA: Ppx/GppA phosphatase family protein [Gemmatimonadales bacterium]|nr:Ppx/GppA phosphatase family protein [Gemmatimonadales bacterium]
MTDARERLAALDVGSNSIRLLVADWDPAAGLTVVDEVKAQPRLAQGLAATGRLDDDAMARAFEVLARMAEVCRRREVSRIAAVATAAVREAVNGEEFVRRVRDELGLPLRIIDAETEAALSYRSVAHHFALTGARALVADIGGGSLELIGAVDGLVELTLSLPLGAVRLTELHLTGRSDQRRAVARLRTQVRKLLKRAFSAREWTAATVIGSGGTFTSLGRMAVARRGLPVPETIHGVSVAAGEVEMLLDWLVTLTPEQRRAVPGLSPTRADIIVAGLAVTAELLALIGARTLAVSAFGLREGLLLAMTGNGATPAADPLRLMREFVERCQGDRRHVEQVRVLARQLFDQLAEPLGAAPEEWAVLEAASLLHDVGQLVSYRTHHRHSYQLIMHADRLNLSARDRRLVALVSRYHRKSGPRRKHAEFAALTAADQAVVRRMSALLRVADGLDRGHTSAVERVCARLEPERLVLGVAPRAPEGDVSLECWGAERKADVLGKLLGRVVVVGPVEPSSR